MNVLALSLTSIALVFSSFQVATLQFTFSLTNFQPKFCYQMPTHGREDQTKKSTFRTIQQVQDDFREERLYFAIQGGQHERLDTLLSSGCNPDHKLEGRTA